MKFIPIGLQCSVPTAVKQANLREYAYPFDNLFSPSKTTYNVLYILIHKGIEQTVEYMTHGYTYYTYLGNDKFISSDVPTKYYINSETGLGVVHYIINDEYKDTLRRRLGRLLNDIKSNEHIMFIYADAANPEKNYSLDNVEYGLDATEYLLKIYDLIYPINNNIKIVYFGWTERKKENSDKIEYVYYHYKSDWIYVRDLITCYLNEFIIQSP
jgi:hypothetical protein